MKSAICVKPKQFNLIDAIVKKPGKNEVLVRIEGCGVCGSNLSVWLGYPWFTYPLEPGAPGHEGWGRIEETGSDVSDLNIGDRVAFLSSHAFAQYDTVDSDAVVKLPPIIDSIPFPGEPLGCAMNVFGRSEIERGQRISVIGGGFLGQLIIQMAVKKGALVSVVSKRKYSLELAEKFSAQSVFLFSSVNDARDAILRQTEGAGFDCVIEATGYQQSLDLASEIVKVRGRLVIAGYHQDGMRTVNMQQWNWKGIDVINAHEREISAYTSGIKKAVDALEKNEIDPLSLFTHNMPIEDINDAFELMQNRPDGFIKALVTI